MTPTNRTPRSFAAITRADLERLAEMADADAQRLYERYPLWRDRFVGAVLAQGAARHFVEGETGVKDFDVWSFFARIPGTRFPFGGRRKVVLLLPSERLGEVIWPDRQLVPAP